MYLYYRPLNIAITFHGKSDDDTIVIDDEDDVAYYKAFWKVKNNDSSPSGHHLYIIASLPACFED